MRERNKKFNVGEGNDIDKNIRKLQRELDDMLLKGAPEIKDEDEKAAKRIKIEEEEPPKPTTRLEKQYEPVSRTYEEKNRKERFGLFKNTKFYIVVFGVIAFSLVLIKAPVFRYTTPPRHDNDIPGIDVGFRYYNNIFGQQTKNETIVYIGKDMIVIPISMQRWYNLEKEKKLIAIEYYRKKEK